MNNGESIKKYNDLLIKYLNDLVNSINPNNDFNIRLFEDITIRLKKELLEKNLDISENGVKTLLSNAFNEYINILKNYFDNSGIHRIDDNDNEINFSTEMNKVTTNLSNSVNNMNKISEYTNLINRIKSTLLSYFKQTYPNYENLDFKVEQILNDSIVVLINNYINDKIKDFNTNTLPTLFSISDSIKYFNDLVNNNDEIINQNFDVNRERDEFISQTMDIEIEEGFENDVVTLKVVDSMGVTNMYYGVEAMEKLTSYNQLFESSRPGKIVDTSRWALDKSSKKNNIPTNTNLMEGNDNTNNSINNINTNLDDNPDKNEKIIKDFLANYEDKFNNENNEFNVKNEVGSNNLNNNDITVKHDDDLQIVRDMMGINNNINNVNNDNNDNNITNTSFDTSSLENNFNNNFSNNFNDNFNVENEIDLQPVREMMGINEDNFSNSFSFLPSYNNPNEERDEFIKNLTGILIEEDIDNKGSLYLKVTEPTGREQIYTGKEAISMIRNYNKVYLESNPDKKVDTSLIDKFDN